MEHDNELPSAEMPMECCAKGLHSLGQQELQSFHTWDVLHVKMLWHELLKPLHPPGKECEHNSSFDDLIALPQWKQHYLRASVSSQEVSCTGDNKKELWCQPRTHASDEHRKISPDMRTVSLEVLSQPFGCRF